MDKNLDLTYLVDAVALVYCDGVYAAGQKTFNGYLASDIIREAGYGNPLILHVPPVMRELPALLWLPGFQARP